MGRMRMQITMQMDGTGAYRCAPSMAPSLDASFAFLELWTNYEAAQISSFEHKILWSERGQDALLRNPAPS